MGQGWAMLAAVQIVAGGDYWPGPWLMFADASSEAIAGRVAEASGVLPEAKFVLCADGASGGDERRVERVRRMLVRHGIARHRLARTTCADRDVTRPAGVRIAIA